MAAKRFITSRPGVHVLKLFFLSPLVIYVRVFALGEPFQANLIIEGKTRSPIKGQARLN